MSVKIKKLKLYNYKRFKEFSFEPNEKTNILIGDNETGKSTIIEAIDLVISGSIKKAENIGVDRIINVEAQKEFLVGPKTFESIPRVIIELYLDGEFGFDMNGKNNSDKTLSDGIRMICEPDVNFENEIMESNQADEQFFPFDYYKISFSTFADQGYSGYKKKVSSIFIDSSNMNSDYATANFVKRMYAHYTESNVKERVVHKSKLRQVRTKFEQDSLKDLNSRIPVQESYEFKLRTNETGDFGNELMIYDQSVALDNKGTGTQIFVKTDFALSRANENLDVILIEEPENHLSHVKLHALIEKIEQSVDCQIFITTHNSLISTRLELRNVFIMQGNETQKPLTLQLLSDETAKYFMKTPPASIIEFTLSNRIILVEGPAEYMLFDMFYRNITGEKMESDDVQILDVRGLSFKRYLEIACITGARVAVVTDNDTDYQTHCVNKYSFFEDKENIGIFYDNDNTKRTFEIVLEDVNKETCKNLFGENAVKYMLENKTEAAYQLMSVDGLVVPDYIERAIKWIRS